MALGAQNASTTEVRLRGGDGMLAAGYFRHCELPDEAEPYFKLGAFSFSQDFSLAFD